MAASKGGSHTELSFDETLAPAMVNQLHALKLLPIAMTPLRKHLILLAMLCLAFFTPSHATGRTASGLGATPERQTSISEAPDPATPFLVGAGLITLSVVIRRRRKLRSKESTATKVNGREDS